MRTYQYQIQLLDHFTGPLTRIQQRYGSTISRMDGLTRHFGTGFSRVASLIDKLKNKLDFRRAGQSMRGLIRTADQLRGRLTRLADRTRIQVDGSSLSRANEQARQLAGNMNRLANGRLAGTGGGGGRGMLANGAAGLFRQALPYVGAAAIGAGALGLGRDAMEQERNQFSLGVMLKSKEQAAGMMGQFRQFAIKNPMMGMEETTQAGTRMVSLNERTDRVMPIIRTVSDAAAGTNNKLSELISILGQVKSKGRLMAEENMQFQERRINLNPYLVKVLGIKENQLAGAMKDGQVGYEQVLRAFNLMTAKGGIYHNMSERMGNETTEGRLNNLLETIRLQLVDMAVKVLPYVSKGLDWANRMAEGLQVQLNGPLGVALLTTISNLSTMAGGLWQFAKDTGLVGSEANKTGTAMTFLMEGLRTVGSLARWIGKAAEVLGPILKALPGVGLGSGGGILKWFNEKTDAVFGKTKLSQQAKPELTQEEKWVKSNGLTGLEANEQHERFLEARWRASQKEGFRNLSKQEQHAKYVNAQAKAMKANTSLLGASGLMKPIKDGNTEIGKAAGLNASTQGAKSTNITINLKSLIEGGVHINAASIKEGLDDFEARVCDVLIRCLNSADAVGA